MKVTCIKEGSKYLVKGETYEVEDYRPAGKYTSNGRTYNRSSYLLLKGVPSKQDPKKFKMSNGKLLSEYTREIKNNPRYTYNSELRISDVNKLKVGDYVKCNTDGLKHFIKGQYYKVTDIKIKTTEKTIYSQSRTYIEKIKLEDQNRFLSTYRFQLLSTSDKRKLSLGELLGDKPKELKRYDRKWDSIKDDNKKKMILLEKILEANKLLQNQSLSLSPKDYILKKMNNYGLVSDDFKLIENMTLKELL